MAEKKIFKLKTIKKNGAAPTPGSVGNQPNTLYVQQVSDTDAKALATDSKGKAIALQGGGAITKEELNKLLEDGQGNLKIGNEALQSSSGGTGNTVIGKNAAKKLLAGNTLTIIGDGAGGNLLNATRGYDTVVSISPVLAEYIKGSSKSIAYTFGYNEETNTITSSNSIFIGYNSGNVTGFTGPTTSISSIHIGVNSLGNIDFRDVNNITLSNFLWNKRNRNMYNCLFIGNHLTLGEHADSLLAIHNSKTGRTRVEDALLFGNFDKRTLKINGSFSIDPARNEMLSSHFNENFLVLNSNGNVKQVSPSTLKDIATNDIIIGGENLVKNTLTPLLGANDTGTGTSVVMEDATGKFTRVTPTNGKAVSLYGFRVVGSNDGTYSKSIDVRHNHTSNISVWGQSIPPNKWTRIKLEKANDSEFFLLSANTPNVALDIRKLKIEHGTKATDWRPNSDEIMTTISASKIDNVFNYNDLTIIGETNGTDDRAIYNIPNLDSIIAILDLYFIFSDGTSVTLQGAKSVMLSSGKKGIPFNSAVTGGKVISKVYLRAILN